jgi:hypothetical protein
VHRHHGSHERHHDHVHIQAGHCLCNCVLQHMATMAVVSVTSSSSNEGVTGVVLNASTYLFFSRTSGVGVTNSGISSSSLDLSRSKPMQPHA